MILRLLMAVLGLWFLFLGCGAVSDATGFAIVHRQWFIAGLFVAVGLGLGGMSALSFSLACRSRDNNPDE